MYIFTTTFTNGIPKLKTTHFNKSPQKYLALNLFQLGSYHVVLEFGPLDQEFRY